MVFFTSDNPIALFIALVLTIAVLKILLGRHKWFKGKNAGYATVAVILIGILLVVYNPLLRVISFAVPYIALLIVFLFAIGAVMFTLGMSEKQIWPEMKKIAILKTFAIILIVCAVALGASQVFGGDLLNEPSVSITDPLIAEEEPVEIDFTPLFARQAMGMIMILIVLGGAFLFINLSS